ncbi:MAG: acyltransferase family protein [Halothermotrichaceae bacterium]
MKGVYLLRGVITLSYIKRDLYFDNARVLLIFLVLLGHFIEPLIDQNSIIKSFYLLIYSFHMPAFIIISGYFSKNSRGFIAGFKNIILKLFIPYIVFQILYSIFDSFILKGNGIIVNFFTPYWIMWFLLSLMFWKLIVSLITFSKKPLALLFVFAIAIMSGYIDEVGYLLSISRTLIFFPFFLIGYFLKKKHFNALIFCMKKKYRIIISALIFTICVIYFNYEDRVDPEWFYGSLSYLKLGYQEWFAGVYRVIVFLLNIINTILFLWIVPTGKTSYSKLGERTIYPYILHGFIVNILLVSGVYSYIYSYFELLYLVAFSLVCLIVLSSNYTQKIFKVILEPDLLDG